MVSLKRKAKIQLAAILFVVVVGGYWCWRRAHWPIVNWRGQQVEKIVAFGDSLTRGYGARRGMDYPQRLSELLQRPVRNAGIDGDTTADGLARLEQDVLAQKPDLVLVCLGGNDLLLKIPAEEAFANLEQIIDRLQEAGAVVALLEVRVPLFGYGNRFKELARRKGCIFVPDILEGVLGHQARMYDDGIHPNTAGYHLVTSKVHRYIQPYIK